jgi:hypothetical protein
LCHKLTAAGFCCGSRGGAGSAAVSCTSGAGLTSCTCSRSGSRLRSSSHPRSRSCSSL